MSSSHSQSNGFTKRTNSNNLDPTGMFRNRGRHVVRRTFASSESQMQQLRDYDEQSGQRLCDRNTNNQAAAGEMNGSTRQHGEKLHKIDIQEPAESSNNEISPTSFVHSKAVKSNEFPPLHEDESNNLFTSTSKSIQSSGAPSKEGEGEEKYAQFQHGNTSSSPINEQESSVENYNSLTSSLPTYENVEISDNQQLNDFLDKRVHQCTAEMLNEDTDEVDSTVSIMGSVINNDFDVDDNNQMALNARWKSAKMMYRASSVNFIHNVDEEDESEIIDSTEGKMNESRAVANPELQRAILNDTLNSFDGEENPVNISMECHVDTSHYTLDGCESRDNVTREDTDEMSLGVGRAANLFEKNHGIDEFKNIDPTSRNKEMIDTKVGRGTIEIAENQESPNHRSSSASDATAKTSAEKIHNQHHNGKDTIHGNHNSPPQIMSNVWGSKLEQESPLRAAFRRTAATADSIRRIASPRLPPSHANNDESATPATNTLLPLPLQLARKCFSFDDTTLDELSVPYQPPTNMLEEGLSRRKLPRQQKQFRQSTGTEFYGLSAVASFPMEEDVDLKKTVPLKRTTKSFGDAVNRSSKRGQTLGTENDERGSPPRVIRQSLTWDCGVGFHTRDGSSHQSGSFAEKIANHSNPNKRNTESQQQQLEGATNLLSRIVNQTLNFNSSVLPENLLCKHCRGKYSSSDISHQSIWKCNTCSNHFEQIINSIRDVNTPHHNSNIKEFSSEMRSDAINVLLDSYRFLRELDSFAHLAKGWLDSGRMHCANLQSTKTQANDNASIEIASKEEEINKLNKEVANCREEIGRLRNITSQTPHERAANRSLLSISPDDSEDNYREGDNSLILYSAHPVTKLTEEESIARRMDADRKVESLKEIIRLKAALEEANRNIAYIESTSITQNQEDPFPSDIEPITVSDDGEAPDIFMKIADDIENSSDDPLPVNEIEAANISPVGRIKLYDPCLEKELDDYRAAVIETISARGVTDSVQDMSKSSDSVLSEQRMVSVKMLDAENFITEWDTISPLPPPPDHGLHSPIVEAIISRWTEDKDTQSALLKWAESILDGASPDDVPPLKIEGLDHQLKEGFVMHVFPLLLRRKDIHVQVTSRATRTTSYDIAVSISPSIENATQASSPPRESDHPLNGKLTSAQSYNRENQHHLMAFHATCNGSTRENDISQISNNILSESMVEYQQQNLDVSRNDSIAGSCYTAITSPISNRTPKKLTYSMKQNRKPDNSLDTSFPLEPELPIMAGASPSLVDDLSVGSSADEEDISNNNRELPQSSLMNSMAFGLLSRKKPPTSSVRSPLSKSLPNASQTFKTPQRQVTDSPPSEHNHPYHRLVSAPAGKIGITFIEHRGHCMVSCVTKSSPLAGYVHPSDILIAVDDIPVSGLRTREIVKLLTARKDHRRDLRMISSHDMNELIR